MCERNNTMHKLFKRNSEGTIYQNIEIYFIVDRYCSFIANLDLIPGRNNTAQIDHFAGRVKNLTMTFFGGNFFAHKTILLFETNLALERKIIFFLITAQIESIR